MLIGLAGHVDHGKSALVAALTGGMTDRLPEERRRGMTMALGYAFAPGLSFLDVPGHERFVAVMAAGAAGIDAALLAVALDDGVMPQTEEHAAILAHLGIDRGVVALTKSDRAPERIGAVMEAVAALLARVGLGPFPALAVSARSGAGIGELAAALRALPARARRGEGPARLAIDRAFVLAGVGPIVTGTLFAGTVGVGDALLLSPAGREVRVRGLHAENRPAARATAGQRVALQLAGPGLEAAHLRAGDFVCDPALHHPAAALDVQLSAGFPRSGRPDAMVELHLAAAHLPARLLPAGGAFARLVLARPLPALAGDRFVLRESGGRRTLGGGVVLDPAPPRRGRLAPARLAALAALAAAAPGSELAALLAAPPGWVDLAVFAAGRGLGPAEVAARLERAGAVRCAGIAFAPGVAAGLDGAIRDALARAHQADPEAAGQDARGLLAMLAAPVPEPVLAAFADAMVAAGSLGRRGGRFHLPGHRPRLAPDAREIAAALAPLLAARPADPPRLRALARALGREEAALRGVLARLCRAGLLVELGPDHFLLPEAVSALAGLIRALAAEQAEGVIETARFRDRAGLGRKRAVEILEAFDRIGLTRRHGQERRLRDATGGRPAARWAARSPVRPEHR